VGINDDRSKKKGTDFHSAVNGGQAFCPAPVSEGVAD
jgi:hypothetical protein